MGIIGASQAVIGQTDSLGMKKNVIQNLSRSDSTLKKSTPFDTTRGARLKSFGKNSKFVFRKTFGIDSLRPNEVPKIAFVRSMILPGWGQMTNKNYLKLPLIYGSAGAGIYLISDQNRQYQKYKDIVVEMQVQGLKEKEIYGGGPYSITLITTAANQYRRYKQLGFVGMGLGWLLFAIEANVSAHLKTFDVSNDISFKASPSLLNSPLNNNQTLGIKLALNF
jgi:hypothetical protein